MIQNLQKAINHTFNVGLLVDKLQWYSDNQNRAVNAYKVKITLSDNERTSKSKYKELFSTTSELQVVLFLRDYWYQLNGWEIPTDNEMWERAKEEYEKNKSEFVT